MLAHRRRMAHCQAFGNPLVSYRGPAFHQRGAHHLSGIALSELFSCLLVVQLLHMDKRSNHPTKIQIPIIHSGFSRRQYQQIQPAELGERPVGGDHLEPGTNGKSGQVSIHPQFR